jgi:hypothetical protein
VLEHAALGFMVFDIEDVCFIENFFYFATVCLSQRPIGQVL